ncbi:ribosomal RNA small subunit methyltransferase A [Patescibacteria group bacterium]|nr:ribosomal RNA small subunit methyltransferase A [Patescibacteria group bacterium]MBU1722178.1 ribosomal RNA small subunit methyltransferase A [Patescibacteria group bacterium]MBU1901129.1 ribosomal RNA small subunit methyltransferase A [Patescibacteria group bacterium]
MDKKLLLPEELKKLCQDCDLQPSKTYGQNYLVQPGPILKMIEAAHIQADDIVVEIGPGFGVLTCAILDHTDHVLAFEIEKKLQAYWEGRQKEFPSLQIIWGNALHTLPSHISKGHAYKVVANLPYQITSFILRTVLELADKPSIMVVMVQKEVAERICAKKGDLSLLAVSVQYYGVPRIVTRVARGSFWPAPKVDSAVLAIEKIKKNTKEDDWFFTVVRAGFSNKRKQVVKNLKNGLPSSEEKIRAVLQEVVQNEKVRAQEIDIEEWKRIAVLLKK